MCYKLYFDLVNESGFGRNHSQAQQGFIDAWVNEEGLDNTSKYVKTTRQDGSELGRRGSAGRRTSGQDEAAMSAAARRTRFGDWRFSKTKY